MTMEAEELADRFVKKVYTLHRCPETIVSDRGTQFVSTFWRALSTRLGVALKPSSAFHPATNGQTERINTELEQYLRLFVSWAQDDWVKWMPLAEFAGNNMVSETTGVSPFYANYGFHPRIGIEPATPPPPNLTTAQMKEFFKASEVADRFKRILDQVTALARQAQDYYEKTANARRRDAPLYRVGDRVMLDTRNLKTGRPTRKLDVRWEGPFEVTKASSHAVTLRLPVNMKIFPTFHVSMVRPTPGEGIPGQAGTRRDIPANDGKEVTREDGVEDTVEWRFERVLDYQKGVNGRWQYLVKWSGNHKPTWEPAGNLRGCDDALWDFHNANPDKTKPSWLKKKK